MQAERILNSYVLRIIVRFHKLTYCLHDLRSGQQLEFSSLEQLQDFLQLYQMTGLDPPKPEDC